MLVRGLTSRTNVNLGHDSPTFALEDKQKSQKREKDTKESREGTATFALLSSLITENWQELSAKSAHSRTYKRELREIEKEELTMRRRPRIKRLLIGADIKSTSCRNYALSLLFYSRRFNTGNPKMWKLGRKTEQNCLVAAHGWEREMTFGGSDGRKIQQGLLGHEDGPSTSGNEYTMRCLIPSQCGKSINGSASPPPMCDSAIVEGKQNLGSKCLARGTNEWPTNVVDRRKPAGQAIRKIFAAQEIANGEVNEYSMFFYNAVKPMTPHERSVEVHSETTETQCGWQYLPKEPSSLSHIVCKLAAA
ncbi:hypothetical protein C8R45DRAFT_933830 [Mycena sanguinolenta]|nr:hypothetical protein C8R45DRAFT_933830 [Mycena sanguinolenta]